MSDIRPAVLSINPRDELEAIAAQVMAAIAALNDEHEGAFKSAVVALDTHAGNLLHLVAAW